MENSPVRVRFAPSPTGFLHVGGLRTALFNFLWARKNKGVFILRIEDTDKSREVEGAVTDIIKTLVDFRLIPDEGPEDKFSIFNFQFSKGKYGPYTQSERLEIYKKHIQILLDNGTAYKCYCSEERIAELKNAADAAKVPFRYDKHCLKNPPSLTLPTRGREINANSSLPSGGGKVGGETFVIRQNIPEEGSTEFDDVVYGHIRIENRTLDDGVLIKSNGWPVYNFANVVDDHLMEISHVIRGEEFISSTPKHILLYQAFGWQLPQFAHLPLLLSRERKKLSKRDGDVAVKEYLDKGYLPEALLNFIAFLGWNPKTERELFKLDELIAEFDLAKINKAGAVFDLEKLAWFNAHYLKQKDNDELLKLLMPHMPAEAKKYPKEFLLKIIEIERARLKIPSEIGERVGYFFVEPEYEAELLIWKGTPRERIKNNLIALLDFFAKYPPSPHSSPLKGEEEIRAFLTEQGIGTGEALWPLRVALTGLQASPGPFEIIDAFGALTNGKEIVLQRIDSAIVKLQNL